MQRPTNADCRDWTDPFWHALRLLLDQRGDPRLEPHQIIPHLDRRGTAAARGLVTYLRHSDEHLLVDLAEYTHARHDLAEYALKELLRSEDEAKDDFASLSNSTLKTYATRSMDHHQSSKVLVQTVDAIALTASLPFGDVPDLNPQGRAAMLTDSRIWVTPRRLDGALPSLLNPVGLWEIKEYWGLTNGGSKMSDAVYEIQLVGTEMRLEERLSGLPTTHIAIIDGRNQWAARRSDLRRMIDLVFSGLVDHLIIGREVLEHWEPLVTAMWHEHFARK